MCRRTIYTQHSHVIKNNTPSCKQSSILPSSSLLDQSYNVCRCISHCFSIRDKSKIISTFLFDVNLQTHYSIFSKILISLSTRRSLNLISQFKESIHWTLLNCIPSEKTISTWQHRIKSKETFSSFIWSMSQFILIELSSSDHESTC